METPGVFAIAFAAAAFGAGVAGWIASRAAIPAAAEVPATITAAPIPSALSVSEAVVTTLPVYAIDTPNPYADSPTAVAAGKRLYRAMNCAGCHSYTGAGNMGPALNDAYWRFGGAPAQIYRTLYEGRPQGMPAWGHALPPDQLWKITAYVSSLGGGIAAKDAVAALRGDRPSDTDQNAQPDAAEGGSAIEGQ